MFHLQPATVIDVHVHPMNGVSTLNLGSLMARSTRELSQLLCNTGTYQSSVNSAMTIEYAISRTFFLMALDSGQHYVACPFPCT